jgi:predicted permease
MKFTANGRQAAKRAVVFVCLLCFAALFSGAFVLSHADHGHEEISGSCTVCALLHNSGILFKALGAAFSGVPFVSVILFAAISRLFVSSYFYLSLIELRSRMNY